MVCDGFEATAFFFAHESGPDNHFFVFLVFILANTRITLNLHNPIKLVM